MRKLYIGLLIFTFIPKVLFAAVGCTLNDPDRDVRRIFKQATNYKTEFISIEDEGGKELKEEIEKQLGDELDLIYESVDVPYAYYTILNKKEVIGYIHGINQKGTYGGMQLILATDLEGKIIDFYYQKISSPEAKRFRDKKFTGQFVGLKLEDFYKKEFLEKIKNYSENSQDDFYATLRGIKKNLILFSLLKMGGLKNEEK